MKVTLKVDNEFEIKTVQVEAGARYWEDTTVDGAEDVNGDLIPCRNGDNWCPEIDLETGIILNWKQGITAEVHYKVCDDGTYYLKDAGGNIVLVKEGYVPGFFPDEHFGDYIIMSINETGKITNWENPDYEDAFSDFEPYKSLNHSL